MASSNGETRLLTKIVCLITILTAIIAPWIYHDRAITKLQTDMDYIKLKIDKIDSKISPIVSQKDMPENRLN